MQTQNELYQVEIISVRRLEGAGNLKAFIDIRVGGALVITQCAVMDGGKRGLFASLPRQLARDGRWRDVIICADDDLRAHYQAEILKAYEEAAAPDSGLGAHRLPQGEGLPA
jgi:DNA-binding cell septation regulator SpoVG